MKFINLKWIDRHGFRCAHLHTHSRAYTHTHTYTTQYTCAHIEKHQPQCLPTYARQRLRNHDNGGSHNSPYWLKWSLIFSSVSRRSANDMFQLQPPHAAAMASYRPPSENMRRRWRRAEGEARDPGPWRRHHECVSGRGRCRRSSLEQEECTRLTQCGEGRRVGGGGRFIDHRRWEMPWNGKLFFSTWKPITKTRPRNWRAGGNKSLNIRLFLHFSILIGTE